MNIKSTLHPETKFIAWVSPIPDNEFIAEVYYSNKNRSFNRQFGVGDSPEKAKQKLEEKLDPEKKDNVVFPQFIENADPLLRYQDNEILAEFLVKEGYTSEDSGLVVVKKDGKEIRIDDLTDLQYEISVVEDLNNRERAEGLKP